ncbi:MAG: tRNA (N6-threonylcarbamoyladenosine(37)-N6)-methyltransferase TrmO [Lentisphaeria bacterium]|nr:tRNA (N6-threonylcarbamoyladenosine(37)-N6)-methyltransferase TrmO [Lentisphaeria bacterium]
MLQSAEFSFAPIGFFKCDEKYRYDTPRQGVFANGNVGVIELAKGCNFEQALQDLDGVERIWVIFVFHNNSNWKTLSSPPIAPDRKIGVFASRSPYRPNPIGLSCVELVKVEGLKIYIRNFDLLDGTPILDIKPYISVADSFPDSRVAWLEEANKKEYKLEFSIDFQKKSEFIYQKSKLDPQKFCEVQLSVNPLDYRRKRLTEFENNLYVIAFRTWRIEFRIFEECKKILVQDIFSNYTIDELADSASDKYNDKKLHAEFREKFFGI